MRSGFLHLKKKMEITNPKNMFELRSIFDDDLLPEASPAAEGPETTSRADTSVLSELDQKRWAVVSFEQIEGGPMTYNDAAALMADLESRGVPGLCIVTEEAAHRMD